MRISDWSSDVCSSDLTYAWMVILGNRGPIVALLDRLGLGNGELLFTRFSSTLGMVHALLPLMMMTLYSVMRKIDPAYIRAARSEERRVGKECVSTCRFRG